MSDINNITLIGNLTRDPEQKSTSAPVMLSIASNGYKDEVSYFDLVAWGKLGEICLQYLKKGSKIAINGRAKQERWDSDGQTRSRVVFVINDMQMLGGKQSATPEQAVNNMGTDVTSSFSDEPFK